MKLAFCLFKYFPYGGLQRDFLRIARALHARGHDIHVYTMAWEGEREPAFTLHFIQANGLQNHTRSYSFAKQILPKLKAEQYDLVIGFNKMPHLDVYYAADVCYKARVREQKSLLYRLLPRYRKWAALEKTIFAEGNKTEIMLISPLQQKEYHMSYQTEKTRFHLLPPGISKAHIAGENAPAIREKVRKAWDISPDDFLLLMVGSGFRTKGVDRAIHALSSLPLELKERCRLFVIGQDNPDYFVKLAKRLSVQDKIHFLGGRNDVPDFMLASDLLLHPAYHENTGTVLLEALVSGLPVLTVAVCGYAHYVRDAKAGVVVESPFKQVEFNAALQKMLSSEELDEWRQNGLAFAKCADIYSLAEKAADLIEHIGHSREPIFAR